MNRYQVTHSDCKWARSQSIDQVVPDEVACAQKEEKHPQFFVKAGPK